MDMETSSEGQKGDNRGAEGSQGEDDSSLAIRQAAERSWGGVFDGRLADVDSEHDCSCVEEVAELGCRNHFASCASIGYLISLFSYSR